MSEKLTAEQLRALFKEWTEDYAAAKERDAQAKREPVEQDKETKGKEPDIGPER